MPPPFTKKVKEENETLKRNQMTTNFEFDKLQRAYDELAQQHKIASERLLLARDVQSEPSGKWMAPRPPLALMQLHETNRADIVLPLLLG